ncbi:MAG: hypothetical protein ACI4IN_07445 [Eubacterium sp.]
MKKGVCLILMICLFLGRCGLRGKNPADQAVQYAQEHTELLLSGAEEALLLTEKTDTTLIIPNDETTVQLVLYDQRDHGIIQESTTLSDIFADGIIDQIQIRERSVEFSCGGDGLGANTDYYSLVYTSSSDPKDIYWYDYRMIFEEKDNGTYGKLPDSDNTFFYYKITDHLYYCEAHF